MMINPLSRRRRSRKEEVNMLSSDIPPRLVVDDVDDTVHCSLPSTSPISQAARRHIRAQLFGMDINPQLEAGSMPSHVHNVPTATRTSQDTASSGPEFQAILAMLKNLRTTATTEQLTTLQRALTALSDHNTSTPSAVPVPSNAQSKLVRRKSLFKPGEATRVMTSELKQQQQQQASGVTPTNHPATSTQDRKMSLETPVRPSPARATTPGDLERAYLGVHTLGTLRVTNVVTPSPSPRPPEPTAADVVATTEPDKERDYFGPVATLSKDVVSDSMLSDTTSDRDLTSTAHPSRNYAKDTVTSKDAPQNSIQVSAPSKLEANACRKRSTTLVGHRGFAQQRSNATECAHENTVSPGLNPPNEVKCVSSALKDDLKPEVVLTHEVDASEGPASAMATKPLDDTGNPSSIAFHPKQNSDHLSRPLPTTSHFHTRPDMNHTNSDTTPRTSLASSHSHRSTSPDKFWSSNDDNSPLRTDSLNSAYTVYDADFVGRGKQYQEGRLAELEGDSASSLDSARNIPTRMFGYYEEVQELQVSELPSESRRPCEEPRFTPKPHDSVMISSIPQPTQDIINTHTARLQNNPGLDHITTTYSNSHRPNANIAVPPRTRRVNFPSSTSASTDVVVDADYLPSPPPPRHNLGKSDDASTIPSQPPPHPNRSKSRSQSRSRSKSESKTRSIRTLSLPRRHRRHKSSISEQKEAPAYDAEVVMTAVEVCEVADMLGRSPYDVVDASPR